MFINTLGRSCFCTSCCTKVACNEGNHPLLTSPVHLSLFSGQMHWLDIKCSTSDPLTMDLKTMGGIQEADHNTVKISLG